MGASLLSSPRAVRQRNLASPPFGPHPWQALSPDPCQPAQHCLRYFGALGAGWRAALSPELRGAAGLCGVGMGVGWGHTVHL